MAKKEKKHVAVVSGKSGKGRRIGNGSIRFKMDDEGLSVQGVGIGEKIMGHRGFKNIVLKALKDDFDNAVYPECASKEEETRKG